MWKSTNLHCHTFKQAARFSFLISSFIFLRSKKLREAAGVPVTWKDGDTEEWCQSLKRNLPLCLQPQSHKPGAAWEPHTLDVLAELRLPPEGTPTRHLHRSINAGSSDSVNVSYLRVYSTGLSPCQIQRRPLARIWWDTLCRTSEHLHTASAPRTGTPRSSSGTQSAGHPAGRQKYTWQPQSAGGGKLPTASSQGAKSNPRSHKTTWSYFLLHTCRLICHHTNINTQLETVWVSFFFLVFFWGHPLYKVIIFMNSMVPAEVYDLQPDYTADMIRVGDK